MDRATWASAFFGRSVSVRRLIASRPVPGNPSRHCRYAGQRPSILSSITPLPCDASEQVTFRSGHAGLHERCTSFVQLLRVTLRARRCAMGSRAGCAAACVALGVLQSAGFAAMQGPTRVPQVRAPLQPLAQQARRVEDTLAYVGQPLADTDRSLID